MVRFKNFFSVLLFLLCCSLIFSSEVRLADVRPIMDEMLMLHVEHKQLSPLLMRRSFKNYIQQFDSGKMYLTSQDLRSFYEGIEETSAEAYLQYQKENFTAYRDLNRLIQKSIVRARSLRKKVQSRLIANPGSCPDTIAAYSAEALNEEELEERISRQMCRLLWEEKKFHQLDEWTEAQREQIFKLWEKRFEQKENTYLQDKNDHFFAQHIIKALAKSLDAHTVFFTQEEALEMRAALEKQFEGVGVVLRESIYGVMIADLLAGGPAHRSGQIAKGDLLVQLDGISLQGIDYDRVLELMKNQRPEATIFRLRRKLSQAEYSEFEVSLKKEKIALVKDRVQYVSEPFADGIIGKIRLPSFYEGSENSSAEKDLRDALKELKAQGNLKALVLDLRDNSGGFLTQAVKVAGLFITKGVIVVSKYAQGQMRYLREIDGRVYFEGPLVILTSKTSASAAEIVAQALQDYGTAVIVGDERTYGKGTIQYQTVTEEGAKVYYKVTVGRYYTPSGKSTQIEGVKADLIVPTKASFYHVGERFLEYPLPADQIAAAFNDPLTDISPLDKLWFQKHYLPYLQRPQVKWQKKLPILAKNSKFRLDRNKDFNLFLKSGGIPSKNGPSSWGEEDLQMAEAVSILKDMYQLP